MSIDITIKEIREWGIERNIIGSNPGGTVDGQMDKLKEEYDELCEGLYNGNLQECADAIGDMTVVLVMLSELLSLKYSDCVTLAYNQIKYRKGKMIDGVFHKEK